MTAFTDPFLSGVETNAEHQNLFIRDRERIDE
jgi:hypothetical protein